jgi:glucan phosphoethanolaminetransferase (alkaline phosphatase superfamily)
VTFFFSLFAIGSFYASQIFRDLGSRSRGINYLMVPASAMEKLLCSLTFGVVLFFLVFTAAFYLADGLMVLIANALHPSYNEAGPEGTQVKASLINVFNYNEPGQKNNINLYILLFFLAIQSLFILGSVYFEKYSFIKTAISMFVSMLIFFLLLYLFNESLMPNGGFHKGFSAYRVIEDNNKEVLVELPQWIGPLLRGILMYALPPFFWTVTYFRLREKQV